MNDPKIISTELPPNIAHGAGVVTEEEAEQHCQRNLFSCKAYGEAIQKLRDELSTADDEVRK